jgi:superfamily I DNA and/or RNA helicase
MSSRLRAIISEVFYNGQLIDASVIEQRQIPVDLQQIFPGTDNPAKFRQTNGFESRICRSYYNDEQA